MECTPWKMPNVGDKLSSAKSLLADEVKAKREHSEYQEKGYAEGKAKAEQEAQHTLQQAMLKLQESLDILAKPLALINESIIEELMQFTQHVTEACILREMTIAPEIITSIFNEIKSKIPTADILYTLHLNPDDHQYLSEHTEAVANIQLVPDSALLRGETRLHSESQSAERSAAVLIEEACQQFFGDEKNTA